MGLKYSELVDWLKSNPQDVVIKQSTRYPELRVVKYRNRVFYNDTWNRYLEECRGLVVDQDWNLVALPLRKMYNYGLESRAPEFADDEWVMVSRKVNGFMCSVSLYNGELLYSTTGSLDSDFVDMAKEMMQPYEPFILDFSKSLDSVPFTMIFEICHPDDPHIIPEKVGVTLLCTRFHRLDNLDFPMMLPLDLSNSKIAPEWVKYTRMKFGDVKKMIKTTKDEGVVVYGCEGNGINTEPRVTKIKSPYYLVKKFFARVGKTDKLMDRGVEARYPEEYHPLIRHIRQNKESFMVMSEQARLKWIREYLEKSV